MKKYRWNIKKMDNKVFGALLIGVFALVVAGAWCFVSLMAVMGS